MMLPVSLYSWEMRGSPRIQDHLLYSSLFTIIPQLSRNHSIHSCYDDHADQLPMLIASSLFMRSNAATTSLTNPASPLQPDFRHHKPQNSPPPTANHIIAQRAHRRPQHPEIRLVVICVPHLHVQSVMSRNWKPPPEIPSSRQMEM